MIPQEFNKNHKKWFTRKCLRAISTYRMIDEGEPVCVALSGGKDSTVLLYILWYLNKYCDISFPLYAAHIKTADYDTAVLQSLCDELGVEYLEDGIRREKQNDQSSICYLCSRLKRGALRSLVQSRNIQVLAYGHHADDVAETFFMNIVHSAKLGAFSPTVGVPDSRVKLIRPMIYLREKTIRSIHAYLQLPLLGYGCPHEPTSRRMQLKENMAQLDAMFHTTDFVDKLVSSLENIDKTNLWENCSAGGKSCLGNSGL